MKVAAALLLCAISLARGQDVELNGNGCPIDYTYELLYAHEICNKFLQCTHGELVEHTCAGDLLFNVEKQECDWPHDTDCGHRVIPGAESEESEKEASKEDNSSQEGGGDNNGNGDNNTTCNCNPGEAPSICAGTGSEGILIAHENCNQFYKCSGGFPVAISCYGDLLYNPYTEVCDWPHNVDCGERVIPDCDEDNNASGDNNNGDNGSGDNGNGNGDNNTTCNCNPGEAPSICAGSESEGVLIAHENCNQFYKCSQGVPVAMSCYGDLLYNPYTEQCDWPQNVECGTRVIPESEEDNSNNSDNDSGDNNNGENGGNGESENGNENGTGSCNCNPGEAPTICAGSGSEGVLIAHENCNQFYKCSNGVPVAMSCYGDLLYNPYTEQCDWPQNVDCGTRVIPECEDDNSNGDNGSGDNNNGENGSGDNNNGENGGDNNGGNGDSDDGNENGTGSCNCNPGEAPAICAGSGSEGTLIAHENCNQFYLCSHGVPVAMSCYGDLLYNPYTERCDWPNNVECGDRVIPECDDEENTSGGNNNGENGSGDNNNGESDSGGDNNTGGNGDSNNGNENETGSCNCNPGEAPTICASNGSEGTFIAHENCNQFYCCSHGVPVVMSCYGDLLYNPYTERCDWPNNVECGDRVIPERDDEENTSGGNNNGENGAGDNNNGENDSGGDNNTGGNGDSNNGNENGTGSCNCNPGEAPTICAGSGSEGTLIAHENCNQFYICSHGVPVAMSCHGDLLYNPYTERCDWPNNVECGDRVIPERDDEENASGGNNNGENGSGDNNNGESDSGGDNNTGGNGDSNNGNENETGSCNCNPGEAPTICASNGSEGTLIAHENCNQFYCCSHGVPVVMSCYGDLLYNPYTERCDWPNNVECGDRVIPERDDEENTSGGNNNGENGAGDNNNGENDSGGDNNTGDNGDSNNGNENGTGSCNCNPGEAPTICAGSGSEGTLIAHENCNQFYICSHGVPVAMSCHGDLLYNPYTERCDWPNNVECGDRVIPERDDEENGSGGNNNGENGSGDNNNGESDSGGDNNTGGNGDSNNGNENGTGSCNCNPGEAPTICAGSGSEGTLIAHENCNQFYICSHGVPVAMSCHGDLQYNPYTERCDWPNIVECGDRVIPEGDDEDNTSGGNNNGENGAGDNNNGENDSGGDNNTGDNGDSNNGNENGTGSCNCNPGEAPTICAGSGSEGTLIAHENCNQFYICSHGVPVAMSCHGDLLYNPYTERCDWPHHVECGDRVIPERDDEENTSGGNNNGENGSGDNNNGESDAGGDNNTGGNGDSNNGNENGTGSCNCNPGEAPTICAGSGSEGTLIAHENCNQFYICSHGVPVAMSCHGDLQYNPYTERCDWPNNVECGDRVIPEGDDEDNTSGGNNNGENGAGDNNNEENESGGDNNTGGNGDSNNGNENGTGSCNCNPGEAPTICAGSGSEGTLIAHENCNQFYICSHGVPVAMSCHGDLQYNPYTERCDWPNNVECGDRVIPERDDEENTSGGNNNGENDSGGDNNTGGNGDSNNGNENGTGSCNCNPGEAPTICAGSGSEGTLIAHENCNQFYICSHGVPVAMSCHGDLQYNPYTERCDWPNNVECGDRVIPERDDEENVSEGNNNGENGSGDNNNGESDSGGDNNTGGNGDSNNSNENGPGSCNCNPGEAPTICAGSGSEGTLIAHENCNQFYLCSHGVNVAMSCYGDLLYNPYTERCDWPNNVNCGDRVIPERDDEENVSEGNNNGENGSGDNNNGESDSDGDNNTGGNGDSDNGNENGTGSCNCNPGEAPTICAGSGSEGTLIAHENCNQFYLCSHGVNVAMSCYGDLLYNPYTERCDWPNNVNCGDRVIPERDDEENVSEGNNNGENGSGDNNNGESDSDGDNNTGGNGDSDNGNENGTGSCNCNPGEAPTICAGSGSEGTLIAHENCNQFYLCSHGVNVAMSCYGDLLYNPYTERCDWPNNVNCGDRVIPERDDEENVSEGNNNGENGSGDNNNGESDSDGDNNTGGNGDSDNGNENGTGSCNCNPGEAPTICAGSGSEGTLIAHENCNQFYLCSHGVNVAMSCYGDLLYNPYTERCDWPNNVNCGDRVIPERDDEENVSEGNNNGENGSGDNNNGESDSDGDNNTGGNGDSDNGNENGTGSCNCNPGEAPKICAGSGSEGTLIAHENCNQFYLCTHGVNVAMSCYGDLLYNPYTERCDWPNNVNCGDRVIPERDDEENVSEGTNNGENGSGDNNNGGNGDSDNGNENGTGSCNCNPGEAPTICAGSGSEGTLIAHENCNQFYLCSHGVNVAMSCYGDLLYNPYTERCDWPNNVNCGDRVIPERDDEENVSEGNNNGENGSGDNNNGESDSDGDNNTGGNGDSDNGNENGTGSCNCNPGEAPTICAGSGSEGILIAHENCNQFYLCSHGVNVAMSCYGDLLYNPYTERCDWPNNVNCGDRVIPERDDEENVSEGNNNGENGSGDNNNGESDSDGDNNTGGNGDSDNGNENGTGSCNCNPGEAPTICAGSGSEGTLIAHENCNQFYLCSNGVNVAMSCYGDLLYNPYTERCDWPNNVECGDRVIPERDDEENTSGGNNNGENGSGDNNNGESDSSGDNNTGGNGDSDNGNENETGSCNCNPGEAPTICAGSGSEGTLIAHENCNQFYLCSHGVNVAMSCYGDLLYNPYTERCDWPNNVNCGDRVIPERDDEENVSEGNNNGENGSGDNNNGESDSDGDNNTGGNGDSDNGNENGTGSCNCNPGEAPTICAGSGSEGTLIAHENCNQFYLCSHGVNVAMSCYGDLLYNPYTERCDWPNNVNCGDRVIPERDDEENVSEGNNNGENGSGDNNNGESDSDGDNNTDGNGDSDNGNENGTGSCNCNPGEAPKICAGSGSEGTLIAHENCNQFYLCSNGVNVAMSCYGDLLYNPYTERCDWPNNVECGDRVIPECDDEENTSGGNNNGENGSGDNNNGESDSSGDNNTGGNGDSDNGNENETGSCNCNPGEAPTICAGSGSEGTLIAHENCNQFYLCSHGVNVAMSCYGDLLYNPYTERCDWPNNVNCGDRVIPERDDEENVSEGNNNGENGSGDNNNGESDSGGNNNGGNGDSDNGNENGTGSCNCNPGEAPTICAGSGSEGALIAHENCNQFYKCSHGIPVAMSCYGDLLYNPYTEQCDWPDRVDCGERATPVDIDDKKDETENENNDSNIKTEEECDEIEIPEVCKNEGSDGAFVPHENCHQFYVCSDKQATVLDCPGILLYDVVSRRCEWPALVDCDDRNIIQIEDNGSCNCNPLQAPALCAHEGSNGELIAHENCDQFYKCSNGVPVTFNCTATLLYNPYKQVCDWPENVDCDGRSLSHFTSMNKHLNGRKLQNSIA
ncbi:uncharacterized protein LOC121734108 isoform X2 [Aricia agestis]|uniref:uncharacterized protein LOC121734108 isoform X2 n=1 Tax=Aricia agestis TaxID=91739 RepID=UPI001C202175|nr:uncharacterized protein LOC121734108 isoform X2 [Aricia agestis]